MTQTILTIVQLVSAILLVIAILLQQQGAGLGAGFGTGTGNVVSTRRGPEKVLFQATIALSIVFFGVSIALLLV